MSYVTTAVIFVDYAPREVEDRLTEKLAFDSREQNFAKLDDAQAGGYKCMQSDVYAAGFSYIDIDALEGWFRGLPWGWDGAAVLLHESEGGFHGIVTTAAWDRS